MKANKTFGFYLTALTTVLSVVCLVLYKNALMKASLTNTFLILAAVAGACALVLALTVGKEIANFLGAVHAVLLMAAIGVSIAPMVNEMGLVFAGLNPKTNLSGFITFAVVAGIAWLLAVIASFVGLTGKEA